jgi:hypothetical protein
MAGIEQFGGIRPSSHRAIGSLKTENRKSKVGGQRTNGVFQYLFSSFEFEFWFS